MEDLHEGTLNWSSTVIQMTGYNSKRPRHITKMRNQLCDI